MTTQYPPIIVGIAGGTGSGKTTAARAIHRALGDALCTTIEHDSYYRDLSHLRFEERVLTNFDHPSALENELLEEHLAAIRAGRAFDKPVYDFKTHTRTGKLEHVEPSPVVIVEGILVLADQRLRDLFDISVFVDTDADVRLMRRIRRDIGERGRTFEDVRAQYFRTVRPMHLEHVEPCRRLADVIVPEGGDNHVGVGLIIGGLRERLRAQGINPET